MQKRTLVLLLFTTAYFLSQFFRSTNAVIAVDLTRELSLSPAELGFMTSLFFAAFALGQIPGGISLDRWGPRWVTPGLMLLGVAGSLQFAAAQSFTGLAVGRALLGLGMAAVMIGGPKAISQWYPPEHFATMTGLLTGIGSLGALIAATPLVWLNSAMGWRGVFLLSALLIAINAVAIVLWTRNTPPGVTWTSQTRSKAPLAEILRSALFWQLALPAAFVGGTFGAFRGLWAGPYLFDVFDRREIEVGNLLLLMSIGNSAGFLATGWLSDRFGLTRVGIALGLTFLLCQLLLAIHPPIAVTGIVFTLFGFSSALLVVLVATARRVFPTTMTAQVLSLLNLFAFGGTFLLQWWMGIVIDGYPIDALGHYPVEAYATALFVTLAGSLLAFIAYVLPMRRRAATAQGAPANPAP